MCQFFKSYCHEDSTVMYTQDIRSMCDKEIKIIVYELNLVAFQTNSNIEFTYSGIDTSTITSQTGLFGTNKNAYIKTSYRHLKADFTGKLNASYEVWFDKYFPHFSDSVRITFSSKEQFNKQKDTLLNNPFYSQLSNDTLILNTGKFWHKTTIYRIVLPQQVQ